jgi:hypothetical protein
MMANAEARSGASKAQIDANRRNARRATGPRTLEGKAIASQNAVKHGLTAQSVLVSGGDCQENPAEFQIVCDAVYDGLRPEGPLEEMLADRIAIGFWRKRRAWRYESAEIRRHGDNVRAERARLLEERFRDALLCQDRFALERTSRGAECLAHYVTTMLAGIEKKQLGSDAMDSLPVYFRRDLDAAGLTRQFRQKGTNWSEEDFDRLHAMLEGLNAKFTRLAISCGQLKRAALRSK